MLTESLPSFHIHGPMPDTLPRPDDAAPHGVIALVNHNWFVEFTADGKKYMLPVRSDDSWNCDIERGSEVRLAFYVDAGGWRIIWKTGMKKFVRISLD